MRKWTVPLGFILFVIGLLSMILKMTGMQFIFMRVFQNTLGKYSFIAYLLLCIVGFMMVYTAFDRTERNPDNQI